jgi:hypothetical protein
LVRDSHCATSVGLLQAAVLLIPFLYFVAAAQASTSNWDDVTTIAPGTEVRIAYADSKPIGGKLENVTDSNLTITDVTGTRSFQRPEIRSVSVKKKGHRLRNALIGLGVGTAAGLAIGGAVARDCSGIACGGARVATGGLVGLIGGTVTGVVWRPGGWRQIYQQ